MYGAMLRETPFVEPAPAPEWDVLNNPDTRTLVTDTLAVPYRWICQIEIVFDPPLAGGAGLLRGTGVLVAPTVVLTAGHTIVEREGRRPTSVYVIPGRNGRTEPLGRAKACAYKRVKGAMDLAVIVLDKEFAARRHKALGKEVLGHWGHKRLGQGTDLGPVPLNTSPQVVVCGYPGDRCGPAPLDPAKGCSWRDQATTQWQSAGAIGNPRNGVRFQHLADTFEGDSGSPVWTEPAPGRRCLVGIHVDGARADTPTSNKAAGFPKGVLTLLRGWQA